jgi:hypothetical protein
MYFFYIINFDILKINTNIIIAKYQFLKKNIYQKYNTKT